MTLEETTQLYASVLRQLLPVGGYDASPNTEALAVDVYAHAKVLAQADIDAHRLLNVLEAIPPELINEYEAEYGLPLKCSVNASRTFEERLQILNWVRTSRNVLNRAYLEQILAIFGVVLIDIVKFKPMQCTASCTSPVNTEQMRYKVFLRLQYPVNADLNCIVENYLPGYLRIEWMVDMPWGDWIVNSGVTVNANGIAHYTAYKTNQREYYDSYANLDLTAAIVRSLHDVDMQQWQAVKDAINELTTGKAWNITANGIEYYIQPDSRQYYWTKKGTKSPGYDSDVLACQAIHGALYKRVQGGTNTENSCIVGASLTQMYIDMWGDNVTRILNPNYSTTVQTVVLSFETIAQKIILNASSSNQAISLLAEAYLEAVANSIFNTESSKQFVKLSDLLSQFELNKTLRT